MIRKKDKTSDFQKFKTISFGRETCNDELTLEDVPEEQLKF